MGERVAVRYYSRRVKLAADLLKLAANFELCENSARSAGQKVHRPRQFPVLQVVEECLPPLRPGGLATRRDPLRKRKEGLVSPGPSVTTNRPEKCNSPLTARNVSVYAPPDNNARIAGIAWRAGISWKHTQRLARRPFSSLGCGWPRSRALPGTPTRLPQIRGALAQAPHGRLQFRAPANLPSRPK